MTEQLNIDNLEGVGSAPNFATGAEDESAQFTDPNGGEGSIPTEVGKVENLTNLDVNPTPSEGSESSELTFEQVRESDAYQELLNESINRRKQNAELKRQIEALRKNEAGASDETPSETQESSSDDALAVLTQQVATLTNLMQENLQNQATTALKRLVVDSGLPEELHELITATDEEGIRNQIDVIRSVVNRPGTGIPVGGQEASDPLVARIKAALSQDNEPPNIFEPGLHRQAGGGGVVY